MPEIPDPGAARPSVRDATLRLLHELGIDTVFGNPGSTELPLFRDFPAQWNYVLGLQESAVVAMADGYAQVTRNAALVNLHSAVGVGHAMGSVFTAFKNQTPLLITAGQQSRSILPFDPFLHSARATELPQPYVKWACEPARAEDVPRALARAYYLAMQPPRGPVFVSIPADDWDRRCDWVAPRRVSRALAPEPALAQELAQALAGARNPVVVAGSGVDRDGAMDLLVELAQRHGMPVHAAPMSARCVFPERHPLFAGFLPAMRERIVERLAGHDLVLVVGAPAFTYHVEGSGPHLPPGAGLWQIVDDPGTAAWTPGGNAMVGSVDLALQALLLHPAGTPRHASAQRQAVARVSAGDALSTAYVLQTLDDLRAADDVFVEEAPGARGLLQQHLPMAGADSFYTMASGGLGFGLPAAVGVALARRRLGLPGRVMALIGDGSAMYSIQALYTAAQLALPITFLILDNRRYAALQDFAPVFGYAPGAVPAGTALPDLDFVRLAEGHGVAALRVETFGQLAGALQQARAATGPLLVEAQVD